MKVLLAALFTVLALSGCQSDVTTGPSAAVTTDVVTPREAFHQVVDTRAPSLRRVPDADLEHFAQTMCNSLDAGLSMNEVALMGLNAGLNANQVGTVLGAGIAWKCPEYETALDNLG
jgi:hypothetical protein